MELECSRCGEEKLETEFYKRTKSKTGFSPWCKQCHAEYDKERYINLDKSRKAKNRRTIYENNLMYVIKYLESHPCVICNESDIVVLDFDHRDETTKKYNVSDMIWTHSISKIQEEIDKCDVMCANCHRKRTAIQFGWRKALMSKQH